MKGTLSGIRRKIVQTVQKIALRTFNSLRMFWNNYPLVPFPSHLIRDIDRSSDGIIVHHSSVSIFFLPLISLKSTMGWIQSQDHRH
ncbi:hypothetical protein PENTCL1PPCAC_26135 [Pristionchus entomophagus]|uniref:Uncharacterized protein n=1 Tax=Pristionchus entomophagus TaxID=358040 RepID=A0AAV5UAQ0_9BILA|nr:hypothetical protein PENTCL1PPCAC_26135 [Pristionchus entomophagus]